MLLLTTNHQEGVLQLQKAFSKLPFKVVVEHTQEGVVVHHRPNWHDPQSTGLLQWIRLVCATLDFSVHFELLSATGATLQHEMLRTGICPSETETPLNTPWDDLLVRSLQSWQDSLPAAFKLYSLDGARALMATPSGWCDPITPHQALQTAIPASLAQMVLTRFTRPAAQEQPHLPTLNTQIFSTLEVLLLELEGFSHPEADALSEELSEHLQNLKSQEVRAVAPQLVVTLSALRSFLEGEESLQQQQDPHISTRTIAFVALMESILQRSQTPPVPEADDSEPETPPEPFIP